MDKEKLLEEMKEACSVGFIDYTGMKVTAVDTGHVEGEIEIEEHHLNPAGGIHGGLVFSLADTIGGLATRTLGVLPTTAASSINYLRPTPGTTVLKAKADMIKRGRNLSVVNINLYNQKDVLLANVVGTYCDLSGRVADESIKHGKMDL